jgi:hypothetical protein
MQQLSPPLFYYESLLIVLSEVNDLPEFIEYRKTAVSNIHQLPLVIIFYFPN